MRSGSLVALCRYRLRRTLGGRVGWAAAMAVMVVATALGMVLIDERPHAQIGTLVQHATRWIAWLGAGPLALSAAANPAGRDRSDGVELMVLLRGSTRGQLAGARVLAAVVEIALRLGLPATGVCLLLASLAPSRAPELLPLAVGVGLFSAIGGALLGILATLCGHYGARRGRGLLILVVLVPWMLAELVAQPGWCVPGALDAVLVLLSRLALVAAGGAT